MKRIVTIMILALAVMTVRAEDLRTLFIGMPDSIIPALTRSDRMDFMDYIDSGMKAKVRNKLGGESVMTRFEDNMLTVVTSGAGRMDMVLFRMKSGSNLICIISTVTAKYDDSRLAFYTENWEPVATSGLIELPVFDDYLTKEALNSDSVVDFKKKSMLRLQAVTPLDGALEFRYTSLDDLGLDADRYRSWIKQAPLRYEWNGKRFKRK